MNNYRLTISNGVITEINSSFTEINGECEEVRERFFIPSNVTAINTEDVIGFTPLEIQVEDGNPSYFAKDGCLLTKEGELVMVAEKFTLPDDGSIKAIGEAFASPLDMTGKGFDAFVVPEGVTKLGYRAFAVESKEKVRITIPACVRTLGPLCFTARSLAGPVELVFEGSPEITTAIFGLKAEYRDSGIDLLRMMPDEICAKPEDFRVSCKAGSSIEGYCHRYNIPCIAA